jgi:hypothetical protein
MTTFLANFPERTELSLFIDKHCEPAEDDLRQTKCGAGVPGRVPRWTTGEYARFTTAVCHESVGGNSATEQGGQLICNAIRLVYHVSAW